MNRDPGSFSDLEADLARLVSPEPRADLRETLATRVRTELDRDGRREFLSRPLPWAAAAALLLGIFLAGSASEASHRSRLAELQLPPVGREMAEVLPTGDGMDVLVLRYRRQRAAEIQRDPARIRWAAHVSRLIEGGRYDV